MTKTNKVTTTKESVPVYRQAMREMRRQSKILKTWIAAVGVIACAFLCTSVLSLGSYKELENKVVELEDDFIQIADEREKESIEYQNMVYVVDDQQVQIEELSSALVVAEDQNIALLEENEEQKAAIEELEERQSKYDRYSYALYDTEGRRNDITYEDLLLVEQLCANSRVDQDLVLSIVMVESEGDVDCSNKHSTARGFGQFLKGTAQFVYEDLMGNGKGTYSHDMAYNGELNLTMMVRYLEYLYSRSSSTDNVINNYRGVKDQPYKNKLNSYLARAGKSLSTV